MLTLKLCYSKPTEPNILGNPMNDSVLLQKNYRSHRYATMQHSTDIRTSCMGGVFGVGGEAVGWEGCCSLMVCGGKDVAGRDEAEVATDWRQCRLLLDIKKYNLRQRSPTKCKHSCFVTPNQLSVTFWGNPINGSVLLLQPLDPSMPPQAMDNQPYNAHANTHTAS